MVIGGLLASTLVTLVPIPVAYTTVAAWVTERRARRRQWSGDEPERQATA